MPARGSDNKSVTFQQTLMDVSIGVEESPIAELADYLREKRLTVAVIESVTGGGIARKLVEPPGASDYFLGGIVAYHTRLKVQYGLVSPKIIKEHGVVSATVTEQLALGVKQMTHADIVIASNGIAGMGNASYSNRKPGTIFLSWHVHNKIIKTKRYALKGTRNDMINETVFIAVSMCLRYLKQTFGKDG